MLQQAIENEVHEFLQAHASVRTNQDRQAVVGNGSLPARKILTGLGALQVEQPRVRDLRETGQVVFTSNLLPRYLRRVPSIDALIPALYLHGILHRGPGGDPGAERGRVVRQQYRPAQRGVGSGV